MALTILSADQVIKVFSEVYLLRQQNEMLLTQGSQVRAQFEHLICVCVIQCVGGGLSAGP